MRNPNNLKKPNHESPAKRLVRGLTFSVLALGLPAYFIAQEAQADRHQIEKAKPIDLACVRGDLGMLAVGDSATVDGAIEVLNPDLKRDFSIKDLAAETVIYRPSDSSTLVPSDEGFVDTASLRDDPSVEEIKGSEPVWAGDIIEPPLACTKETDRLN